MNDFTNSYPLLELQKLQEVQRAFAPRQCQITLGDPDNASGVRPCEASDVSSFGAAAPYFEAARTTLAYCVVAISLATFMGAAQGDSTQRLTYPAPVVRRRQGFVGAPAEDRKPGASVEFTWNRSIYRARKAAKEYSS